MSNPEDAQYREMIVRDLDDSMLVEAGAGSGKTTSLVDRMLALIGAGKCSVDTMAAVTFTRKAASELRGRFQIALEKSISDEKNKDRRSRLQGALEKHELLFAGTIHSFCARLLRERPVEARLDPDFSELEEDENSLLRDQCWSEQIENLHAGDSPVLAKVIELGLDPAKLIGAYQMAALYPEVEVVRLRLKKPNFSKERQLLQAYLDQAWKALPSNVPENDWDVLQSALRLARLRMRNANVEEDRDYIKIISGFDKDMKATQYKWPTKEIGKEQTALFENFRQEVVSPCLDRWRSYCHYFIMEMVIPAVDYFKKQREKDSLMNYHDLLLKAAELLRDNAEVRSYFQERFTHILVDEFQDTDPIQAEVILYLAGWDYKEKSWRKIRVKPGALFIVGDPKQSIYRFRRADIDTYNEVKEIIVKSGGRVIPLTANFRSLPPVCEWVNPIFREIFPAKATRHQPAYEPLAPVKATRSGGIKRITIEKIPFNPQKEIAGLDAERIASFIGWALKGNLEVLRESGGAKGAKKEKAAPGDFMILLRYKKHLPIYARSLEARGIQYEISGGGAFNESMEIRQLMNLLRSVAEPEDQVSLLATLRGMFYGISDDLLYRFKKGGGVFSYLAAQGKCTDEEAKKSIEPAFAEINEFHRWGRTKPPAAALSMMIDRLGIIPLAKTREMGESRAGNLLKTLEIAFWESGKGATSFPELVERLEQYFTELEVEEMSVEPGKEDVVRIMNLHKAKGLEAAVVFLADPVKDASHEPEIHVSRKEEKALGCFVASQQEGEYKRSVVGLPPDWDKYLSVEEEYQRAEEERLLYVAVTRAKQLLVVSRYPHQQEKGAWTGLYPRLENVEELESPEEKEPALKKGRITKDQFRSARVETAARYASVKAHTYEVEAVTKASKPSGAELPFATDTGLGMSWGRIIHRMLEAMVREEKTDLELIAENLLKEEERLLSEKDLVVRTVKAVMASELWKRMKTAKEVLVEVPFSLKVVEESLPKVISGVIDLAFRESDGWVIADYKTDKVDGNLDALLAYYSPQVEMYRKFWVEMSKEKVKEAGLYFVEVGQWVIV